MQRNYIIAGALIIGALIIAAVLRGVDMNQNQVACTQEAKICPDGSAVGRQGPNCEFAPCPEFNQEIKVSYPKKNDAIGLPLTITGEAKVFEDVFGYRLLNANGKKLLEGFGETAAGDADKLKSFSLTVNYPDPETEKGTLELIEFAVVGGKEESKIEIPVRFAPVESVLVEVHFNNMQKNTGSLECEKTYPVMRRVAKTPTIAAEALRELLRGVSQEEGASGYMTALNYDVELVRLEIKDGVAFADFNEALGRAVAGSCRVGAIRAQIENTLLQFTNIQSVVISINGISEGILQP